MRFAALMLCCLLSVSLYAATNLFYGAIRFDACARTNFVTWSNLPPAVVVEHSLDLTNWLPVLIVSRPLGDTNRLAYVQYQAADTNAAVFMRLREIQPIAVPTR